MPYDKGAVHPAEIALALRETADIVFGLPDSEHARRLVPVMESFGTVLPLTGVREVDRRTAGAALIDGIVTFSERMIVLAGNLAADLDLPYQGDNALRCVTDKAHQRRRLREAGIETMRVSVVRDASDWDAAVAEVGLPAVLKPTRGGGSRETYLVHDEDQGRALTASVLTGAEPFVLEELLRGADCAPFGDYVSVETVVSAHEVGHVAVTGKLPCAPPFREIGQFWPAQLPPGDAIRVLELVSAALQAIEFDTGVTHTEVKLTPDGPRIIEVNGRLGGHIAELARRAAAIDMVKIAALTALGARPETRPLQRRTKVYWQHNSPAPREACELTAIDGWRDALDIAGVATYTPYLRVGSRLPGGVMTAPLDLLCGKADDHAQMMDQIAEVGKRLVYTFRFRGGVRAVPMMDLRNV